MVVRHARKRIDIAPGDLVAGALGCLLRADAIARERVEDDITDLWPGAGEVVCTLSARSAFDLLLAAVDWPAGSEILFSGITIPHLPRLAREHGFVPVGVDVDLATAAPSPDGIAAAVTPRTRGVVIAHLFGARMELGPVRAVTDAHGLLLIEDRAQCYQGRPEERGGSDVVLYSFGTIKTATCAGGGVALVSDPRLAARMRAEQRTWAVQPRRSHLARLTKTAAILLITAPTAYPVFWFLASTVGTGDAEQVVRSLSRGFSDHRLLDEIRRRPSVSLLRLLRRRLRGYDARHLTARAAAGVRVAAAVPAVAHLGGAGGAHTHWLFPLLACDSESVAAVVTAGRAAGFDLTAGASVLAAVDEGCPRAIDAMARVVYLPVSPAVPPAELDRLAALIAPLLARPCAVSDRTLRDGLR